MVAPSSTSTARGTAAAGGAGFVALAAALWGTDALFRTGPAASLPASTIVFVEHVVLVLLTAVWLPAGWRALRRAGWRAALAVALIGVGASAVATALFTSAFRYGDPVTPVLLQKVQPLIAIGLAAVLLRERPQRAYLPLLLVALAGAWLIAFPDPLAVSAGQAAPALLALGAAALWGAGTVLGRYVAGSFSVRELTALRFAGGLVGSLAAVLVLGTPLVITGTALGLVVLLALVPGLLALLLYYRGLQRTPAMVATLAELAFPLTATLIGVLFLDTVPSATQVVGIVVVAGVVVALSVLDARRAAPVVAPAPEPLRRGEPVGAAPGG